MLTPRHRKIHTWSEVKNAHTFSYQSDFNFRSYQHLTFIISTAIIKQQLTYTIHILCPHTHSPVEVSAPGIQPSVLILFHNRSIEIPSLESLVQDVGCHSGGVHCCVNALSSHGVSETSGISDNKNVVCKRRLFTSNTKSSWRKKLYIDGQKTFQLSLIYKWDSM